MPTASILLVDDEPYLRLSLRVILTSLGYKVREAEEGFSALAAIRDVLPDILLSDLAMPGMSGFELLSVVRRRHPAIKVIAMSAIYTDRCIPVGIAADAFHRKGAGLDSLFSMLELMTQQEHPPHRESPMTPIWISKDGHQGPSRDPSGPEIVMIPCPECLRTFPQSLEEDAVGERITECIHCHIQIPYAVVESIERTVLAFNGGLRGGAPQEMKPI